MFLALFTTGSLYFITDEIDLRLSVSALILFSTGIVFWRAPFSKRRVDGVPATCVKVVSIVFMTFVFWHYMPQIFTRGPFEERALAAFLTSVAIANIYLILSMKRWRRGIIAARYH